MSDEFDNVNADILEYTLSEEWKKHKSPEFFTYRKLWDEVPVNKTEMDYPINLDIETTDICNLKCPGCPRTVFAQHNDMPLTMMSREEYANIIDQAVEMGVKAVKLNYNGEPLAHKDIAWHIKYAKDKGIIDVIFNTNGALLKKEKAEEILKAGVDGVFFSIDAVSPDVYEKRRVGARFGQVVDNIYNFIKLKNEIRPSCRTRVSMVMFKGEVWQDQLQAMKVMWNNLIDSVGYSDAIDFDDHSVKPEKKGWWCAQPFQRMILKISGKVGVCCYDNDDELVIGNWRESSLKEIWAGEAFKNFRQLQREGKYHSIDICSRCPYPYC